ncbi:uncharacterized protein PV07_04195 [Cladophialophora immunda]|uniref:DUF6594 domain-containing protein n=1 Tax=Cladophialophora immunda TaxID=569365 RepID=A0A0D1ZWX8_9EURO|nr:uncharacterized protein PV07_04195 [Cladophialophora immunda]KIW32666.1 hypothetical protein PV07_04195 [Cladophialophora immunda]
METAASAPAPMQPPDTHDYNPLAIAMESNPRFAMFKRFGSLAVLNLIQLQKELEKRKCIIEGKNSSEEKNQALEDSHQLLTQAAKVTHMSSPSRNDWDALRNLEKSQRPPMPCETPSAHLAYVALESPESRGGSDIGSWLSPWLARMYWKVTGYRLQIVPTVTDLPTHMINDADVFRTLREIQERTAWVYGLAASVVAALVPSLTILWLYNAQRTMTRIWITMGLTTLIGVVLRVVTKAHVSEIFGITAAFAAVEVVFIGSANGNSTAA